MSAGMILFGIIVGIVALLFIVLGWQIWIKEKIELIHSYHYERVEDKKGYTKAMGIMVFLVGVVLFVDALLAVFNLFPVTILGAILIGTLFIMTIVLIVIQGKYNGGMF